MATKETGAQECSAEDILALVEAFSVKDATAKTSLAQLVESHPLAFCAAAIRVLADAPPSPGTNYLVHLLTKGRLLTASLLDPSICSVKDAAGAARAVAEAGTKLQPALEIVLGKALQSHASSENVIHILRTLDVLDAISAQSCWNTFQMELMAYPDRGVRSKTALLIGRNRKSAPWLGRRLMDRDVRVQANAVEALWGLDAADSGSLLQMAVQAGNNRVAGNAALGLYLLADPAAVQILLDMAQHTNPLFRVSALWAIGETQDPRFLPFLTGQYRAAQGKVRLAIAGAMSRIRRREKSMAEAGTLEIHVMQAVIRTDARRRLAFALARKGAVDLSGLKPTDFALWETGTLIHDYEVQPHANPALLVAGFVAPRFMGEHDPYGDAIMDGLTQLSSLKRPDDLWRIDRFSMEAHPAERTQTGPGANLPYDDSLVTPDLTMRYGFLFDPDQVARAISLPVPPERAAANSLLALERQCEAMTKLSGKRHLFLFLNRPAVETLDDPGAIAQLRKLAEEAGIALHAFCVDAGAFARGRDLCLALPEGTFAETTVDRVAGELEQVYAKLLNRYEILYDLPPGEQSGPVQMKISTSFGAGQADIAFTKKYLDSHRRPSQKRLQLEQRLLKKYGDSHRRPCQQQPRLKRRLSQGTLVTVPIFFLAAKRGGSQALLY
jgi:HEAT repeat protein